MRIEYRSVPLAIVFSLLTCGIYMIYWEYKILESLYRATNRPSSAGADILLSIVTCGIYGLYMLYRAGKMETRAMMDRDLPEKDEAALYLVLGIFGLAIVSFAILQSNINNFLSDDGSNDGNDYYDPQQRPN